MEKMKYFIVRWIEGVKSFPVVNGHLTILTSWEIWGKLDLPDV